MTTPNIDWDSIEREYRLGRRPLRHIAAEFGLTEGAIRKRAKAEQWPRDLSEIIRLRAETLVRRADLKKSQPKIPKAPKEAKPKAPKEALLEGQNKASHQELVAKTVVAYKERNPEKLLLEDECVENSAQIVASITIKQRTDISSARSLAVRLLGELEETTDNGELFSEIGELLASKEDSARLADVYMKVISFPTRIKAMKDLADTLRVLIELERKVYKMEDAQSDNPLADFIKRISGNTIKPVIEGDFSEVEELRISH